MKGRTPLEPDRDGEIREEIRFYLEERAKELEAQGLSPEDAARAARDAFGDPERVASQVREVARGVPHERRIAMLIESTLRDIRYAARGLLRRPTLTVVVVLTLALGIGAVTAVFSVVNATLVRALPFPEDDRLVFLQGAYDAPEGPQVRGASPPEARDWESMSRSFTEVAAFDGVTYTLTGLDGPAERVNAERVDAGYFDLLGTEPVLGRTFVDDEYTATAMVAVLGEGLWTRTFGRSPDVVGRSITLNEVTYTIVGVVPERFPGVTLNADLWVPLVTTLGEDGMQSRGSRFLGVVARLRPGVEAGQAQDDMGVVAARLEELHPEINLDRIALVTPLREVYLGSTRTLILVLMAATTLLLVIAAANVANLLLVRSWARSGELLMRRALGAGRVTIARQFLTESLVLAAAGAAGGLILGLLGARLLARATPTELLPAYVDVTPDVTVFVAVVGVMGLVGIFTGLVPALVGDRGDLAGGLRERGQGGLGRPRSRFQGTLVVAEVGLALLLLVGAGLMVRSFRAQLGVDPGFDYERLFVFTVGLPAERYTTPEARRAAMDALAPQLGAIPGVSAVTFGPDAAPLRGGFSAAYLWTEEGGGVDDRIRFYIHQIQPGWFDAMGVPISAGRPLAPSDAEGDLSVAVISRAMAERHFGDQDPVGRTLIVGGADGLRLTVVGVAEDVHWRDLTTNLLTGPDDPDVYLPWTASSGGLEIVLRTDGDPAALTNDVRRVVQEFDPDLPPSNLASMTEVLRTQTAQGRFGSLLLTAFSALAAVLAAVGLYGVLSFAVGRRTREIAVRMAMGADGARLRRMVVRQGLGLAGLGIALGIAVAVMGSHAARVSLYGVRNLDPATYAMVATLMAGVTALASWIPARRATRVDPHAALSSE